MTRDKDSDRIAAMRVYSLPRHEQVRLQTMDAAVALVISNPSHLHTSLDDRVNQVREVANELEGYIYHGKEGWSDE